MGAVPGIQLAHAGRKGSRREPWNEGRAVPGWVPPGPSAIPFGDYAEPRAMGEDDIAATVQAFADAARRSVAAGYRVVGYFFRTETRAAIARNKLRQGKAVIPIPGILGTYKKLEEPRMDEGFDELHAVTLTPSNAFVVEPFVPAHPPPG